MYCPICGHSNNHIEIVSFNTHGRHLINKRDRFNLLRCENCQAIFTQNVKVNSTYYQKYYEEGYYDQTDPKGVLGRFLSYISNLSTKVKQNYIYHNSDNKNSKISILDIGCGSGNFLSQLDSKRFDKLGQEINPEGCEQCRKKGLKIFCKDLSKINFENKKFDVITLWQVLEHVEKPRELMKTIRGIIKPQGILMIQVPNTTSLGFNFGHRDWFHMDSPRHLVLYNTSSVLELCNQTGFKVIKTKNEFYDYPLDLFWSVRNSKLKFLIYLLYPFFKLFSREQLTFICRPVKTLK